MVTMQIKFLFLFLFSREAFMFILMCFYRWHKLSDKEMIQQEKNQMIQQEKNQMIQQEKNQMIHKS